MKIKVTRKHINTAIKKDSHHCMIADAIKEKHPLAQYIQVDVQSIRFSNPKTGKRYIYMTPPIAQMNLLKFDKGDKTLKPFEFTVGKPRHKSIGIRKDRVLKPRAGGTEYAKKRKVSGKPKRVVAYQEREFGLRKMAVK